MELGRPTGVQAREDNELGLGGQQWRGGEVGQMWSAGVADRFDMEYITSIPVL